MNRSDTSSRRGARSAWYGVLILAGFAVTAAQADSIDLGYMSFDVTGSGTAQLDIVNLTGPNSVALGDSSFPVTTGVSFDVTSLSLGFSDGTTKTFGSSYFTTSADGLSPGWLCRFRIGRTPARAFSMRPSRARSVRRLSR